MRLILLIVALIMPQLTISASLGKIPIVLPVVRVLDGDTIETNWPLPPPLNIIKVRLSGIDTPEMPAKSYRVTGKLNKAKCIKEAELALKAKQYVESLLSTSKQITITDYKYDKFGGRIDANITINNVLSLSQLLISKGFAKPYFGYGSKPDWCK